MMPPILRIANASNGLWLEPNAEHISHFLSSHAHHPPYVRVDAMPLAAVRVLLLGGLVEIVDGSAGKAVPDSLAKGVGTWALAFNRAVRAWDRHAVPWSTKEMAQAALSSSARKLVRQIRRLARIYGDRGPIRVGVLYDSRSVWNFAGKQIPRIRRSPSEWPAINVISRKLPEGVDDQAERWMWQAEAA